MFCQSVKFVPIKRAVILNKIHYCIGSTYWTVFVVFLEVMADEDSAAAADLEAAINVRDAILFPDLWWGLKRFL